MKALTQLKESGVWLMHVICCVAYALFCNEEANNLPQD
jgi:hypothetical protein